MAKKLFIGGLAWSATDDDLRQSFERFGELAEAKVVIDRATGRSKGFGFVTFVDDQGADEARAEMNGAEILGRAINVDEAQPRPDRDAQPRGVGGARRSR